MNEKLLGSLFGQQKSYFAFQGYNIQTFYITKSQTVAAGASNTIQYNFTEGKEGFLKEFYVAQISNLPTFTIFLKLNGLDIPYSHPESTGGVPITILPSENNFELQQKFNQNDRLFITITNPNAVPLDVYYKVLGYYFR